MSTHSAATPVTTAEKRKNTITAKIEKERQAQVLAAAETKNGRQAKANANKNKFWNVNKPVTRKRTSSTVQASETVKKARGVKDTSISDPSDKTSAGTVAPSKVKAARKYAPAPIEESDINESEPVKAPIRLDFTNLPPYKAKSKAAKVKSVVAKGVKVLTRTKAAVKKSAAKAPRVVAESVSEAEAVSSDASSDKGTDSDKSDNQDCDISPNEEEFHTEVTRVVSQKVTVPQADSEAESDADVETIPRAKGKQRAESSVKNLFASDAESIEIDKPRKTRKEDPDSDGTISDAPKCRAFDSDIEMHEAIAKGLTTIPLDVRSRRSSAASWSSGQDLCVPDSDDDEDVAPKQKAMASHRASEHDSDADMQDAIAKSFAPAPAQRHRSSQKVRHTRPTNDSDIEMHEAMAKALTTVPRSDHSRHSSAASGRDHRVPDSDADSGDEDHHPGPKKPRKVLAARQKQVDSEKPEVRPAAGTSKGMMSQLDRIAAASVDAASRPESEWHISARIMFPAPGKDIGLTDQGEELKAVLRGCIEHIKISLLFDDSYPTINPPTGFARANLLLAAHRPESAHIKHRLETDMNFTALLADIPLDRINILRGDFKRITTQEVPGLFKFAHLTADETKTVVNGALQDHWYMFTVDPATGRLKVDLPFNNDAIVSVLKKAVFTGKFRSKHNNLFCSTSKRHPARLEVADPMTALAATAVYGALVEYRATGRHQKIPFTEGAYEDTYRNHMKTLSETRASAPVATHRMLHALFNRMT